MLSRGKLTHLTTPATDIEHPLHTWTLPEAKANNAFHKYTIRDNPMLSLEQIEEEIEACGGLENIHCQRELFCGIKRDAASLIVPHFIESEHVKESDLPDYCTKWVCGDGGGVRDKTVIHLMAYDHIRNKIVVFDELIEDNSTASGIITDNAKAMEERHGFEPEIRYIDLAGQLRIDWSIEHGYDTVFPRKEEFDTSVLLIREAFRQGRMEIHPNCTHTIAALNACQLNDRRTDFKRTIKHGHADAIASLIYGIRWAEINNPTPTETDNSIQQYVGQSAHAEDTTLANLMPEYE